ncbi:hypothetical protein B0H21DRAFT_453841 [Amylocystis lapponica]|nr:hypothetical protein B0H21DRAFT_453841 [Amylocystis lapponica]
MSHAFPPELCDRIVDFLWDERAALKNCSLTCRTWLPRSRHHLLRALTVELFKETQWELFADIVRGSVETGTMLGHYIRHLHCWLFDGFLDGEHIWFNFIEPDSRISQLLTRLDALQELTIDGHPYGWRTMPSCIYDRFVKFVGQPVFSSTVTVLRLRCIQLGVIDDFIHLLSSLPRQQTLDLMLCHVACGPPPMQHPSSIPDVVTHKLRLNGELCLHIGRLSKQGAWDVSSWLVHPPFEMSISTLRWVGATKVQKRWLFRDLLAIAGPSLRHVHLTLNLEDNDAASSQVAPLGLCRNLLSVHIYHIRVYSIRAHARLHTILEHIHSEQLEEVHIMWLANPENGRWEVDEDLCRIARMNPQVLITFHYAALDASQDPITGIISDLLDHLPLSRAAGVRMVVKDETPGALQNAEEHWLR